MDLPLFSCFASSSHRVLENFKENVVEMGRHICCSHRALCDWISDFRPKNSPSSIFNIHGNILTWVSTFKSVTSLATMSMSGWSKYSPSQSTFPDKRIVNSMKIFLWRICAPHEDMPDDMYFVRQLPQLHRKHRWPQRARHTSGQWCPPFKEFLKLKGGKVK